MNGPDTKLDDAAKDGEAKDGEATHHIAVLQQDNGELAEDVVHRRVAEQADRVVDSRPVPEMPGRDRPDAPLPGTLPGPAEEAEHVEREADSAGR